jgi:hypothetical protein
MQPPVSFVKNDGHIMRWSSETAVGYLQAEICCRVSSKKASRLFSKTDAVRSSRFFDGQKERAGTDE